ncbi:hypothetical protein WUBG_07337 [Wuchereria bancrofti]|uniref:F-box domain-containing protein n=1 Tax=Wuchereria bancrofti TaxID=6293 RepID=J9EHV5_WUCBA|nr:hypothetical protein WUBG_07337 [Wuchereria bancrofti]
MEYEVPLPTLQQLPIILLSQIASNLNIYEQKSFSDTCRAARSALKLYWNTYTDLHIGAVIKQAFSIAYENRYSLHTIRKEIAIMLRLIPDFTLRTLHFQPICSLHLWDLQDIEMFTRKSAKQIYGALKHLDLRGCLVEYNELKYFSNACSKLSSIAVTHAAIVLPNELFENEKLHKVIKQNTLEQHPFEKMHDFLRLSLPKFTEMEKNGELPVEHIELITKLLILFPYLETFHID